MVIYNHLTGSVQHPKILAESMNNRRREYYHSRTGSVNIGGADTPSEGGP